MQTTPLLQSQRVGEEKMKIVNIDLTKPNWREEAEKLNKAEIRFTLIQDLTKDKQKYISSMSGGLEHKLAKIYIKIINKLSKYK